MSLVYYFFWNTVYITLNKGDKVAADLLEKKPRSVISDNYIIGRFVSWNDVTPRDDVTAMTQLMT